MITDEFIKSTFIKQEVSKDLQQIRQAQLEIARDGVYHHGINGLQTSVRKDRLSGKQAERLISALSSNAYQISGSGEQLSFKSTVPIYIRFLDMKHLGNWRIYNRQIWGILYNNAYQNIRYGFTKEIRQFIINNLDPHHYNIKSKV